MSTVKLIGRMAFAVAALSACGPARRHPAAESRPVVSPAQEVAAEEPQERSGVATASTSAPAAPSVVEQGPQPVQVEAGPTCDPCSFDCLNEADKLKSKDPTAAKKLAELGCDIDKCGYLSPLMTSRCREYGLPPAHPQDCQNQCIGECNSVDPNRWDACMAACEKRHGCSGG